MYNHIVSVDELKQQQIKYGNKIIILDVRKPQEYAKGHIPGAINIWRPQYENHDYNYGGMMATRDQMEQLLTDIGVSSEDKIILYDAK